MAMGRSAAAYDALRTYIETIVTVLNDAETAGNGPEHRFKEVRRHPFFKRPGGRRYVLATRDPRKSRLPAISVLIIRTARE